LVYGRLELHINEDDSRFLDALRQLSGIRFGDEYGNTTLTWYLKNIDQAVEVLERVSKAFAEKKASLRAKHDER